MAGSFGVVGGGESGGMGFLNSSGEKRVGEDQRDAATETECAHPCLLLPCSSRTHAQIGGGQGVLSLHATRACLVGVRGGRRVSVDGVSHVFRTICPQANLWRDRAWRCRAPSASRAVPSRYSNVFCTSLGTVSCIEGPNCAVHLNWVESRRHNE